MAHLGVQKMQAVFQAGTLDFRIGRGVELGTLSPVDQVDLIHIFHQVDGLLLAHILIQGAAELIGDIVFSVGKGARAAEAAHDRAGGAFDAGLDLLAVNGAFPALKRIAQLEHTDFQPPVRLGQLISAEYSSGACAHDDHIIIHSSYSFLHDAKKAPVRHLPFGNQQPHEDRDFVHMP